MTLNITIWTKYVLIITAHNTDGIINKLVTVFAFAPATKTNS